MARRPSTLPEHPPADGRGAAPAQNGAAFREEAPRVAIVHDWLPVYAGAERVLEQMIHVFPQADLFSLIDFLPDDQRAFLQGKTVQTSFIQRLPFARSKYRHYLPLAPLAIEQFDLTGYDIVISSSYAVAKGVLTTADQLHVSYVHSPIRYAWDLQFQYLRQGGIERGVKSVMARAVLHYMRLFDVASANRVDAFLANSGNVARRIWNTYRREAAVVYPPVDTEAFALQEAKEDFYVTLSRLVPYKRVDLVVEAFAQMPEKELLVIGDGPEYKRIAALAGPNVTMLGYQPDDAVRYYMQRARGFIFAAEEDFGIVPLEAQACGTPVVAYGKGGALETVLPGETGFFFEEQTPEHLAAAVRAFEQKAEGMSAARIRENAERFSAAHFREAFYRHVAQAYHQFKADARRAPAHA